ncbi:hypothetical protein K501DRAFT_285865 [Backusella circina FSU 941]|nr:hypothetical protein K501DRAFT_285865 [Backusella circina FSU 941]
MKPIINLSTLFAILGFFFIFSTISSKTSFEFIINVWNSAYRSIISFHRRHTSIH